MYKSMLVAFALLTTLTVNAAMIEVSRVTSDQDSDVTILYANTNESDELVSMQHKALRAGKVIMNKTYSMASLRNGVTINEQQGHKVVILKLLSRFEPIYGGPLQLDYLVNGLTGRRTSLALEFIREGDSWKLKKAGKTFSRMYVSSNKLMGQVVGIDSITVQ